MTGKLVGKVFFITGCSAGIGIETARALLTTGTSKQLPVDVVISSLDTEILLESAGADLYLTARDMSKGQKVIQDILASSSESHGKVELLQL